jgi:hypothetical protein
MNAAGVIMSYFFTGDHSALASSWSIGGTELQETYRKFIDLHMALYPRLRNHNVDLHPRWQKTSIVSYESAASLEQGQSLVLTYFRSHEQAEMVERLMGKDHSSVETYRHPVIELRLTPENFAIELILSPYAWWDQQNFIGKLELANHRSAFRSLLRSMDSNYRFGFWGGTHLSDMHLTNGELLRGKILDEWMDTFADGQDWLRVGKWYSPEDTALDANNIIPEVFGVIESLHNLYQFLLWTSNNNFHSFYEKRHRQLRRSFA